MADHAKRHGYQELTLKFTLSLAKISVGLQGQQVPLIVKTHLLIWS